MTQIQKTAGKTFVNISNVRLDDQAAVMQKIVEDGVCPFCSEHLDKYHKEPILKKGQFWIVTKNQWPYKDTKNHFLAISKEHVESFLDLDPEAGKELIELFQKISQEFEIPGGAIAMRFGSGSTGYASSVNHLHAHFIQPDVDNPNHKGVKFPMSKDRE